MKIERLLAIMILLLQNEQLSTKQLAEKFCVSKRTIIRDILTLEGAGVPIVSKLGRKGGYTILDTYKMTTFSFSNEEKQELLSALQIQDKVLSGLEKSIVVKKKLVLLQKEQWIKKNNWVINSAVVHKPEIQKYIKTRIEQLTKCMQNRKIIEITYTDLKGKLSQRRIHPLSLSFTFGTWYVIAYCEKRKENRQFKLTRIREVRQINQCFNEKKGIEKNLTSSSDEVCLLFDSSELGKLYDYYSESEISQSDEGILVTFKQEKTENILPFLLMFAEHVKVIQPASLTEKHRIAIKKMSVLYK